MIKLRVYWFFITHSTSMSSLHTQQTLHSTLYTTIPNHSSESLYTTSPLHFSSSIQLLFSFTPIYQYIPTPLLSTTLYPHSTLHLSHLYNQLPYFPPYPNSITLHFTQFTIHPHHLIPTSDLFPQNIISTSTLIVHSITFQTLTNFICYGKIKCKLVTFDQIL